MSGNNDNWIKSATYQKVANDLRKLAHTMKNEEKAVKAHNLAQKIASYSEQKPAPEKLQHQITHFSRKRELYVSKQKNEQKSQSIGF